MSKWFTQFKNIILHFWNLSSFKKYLNCDEFGFKKKFINITHTEKPDYKYYYIDHFYFKSTEEFTNKINRGDCFYGNKTSLNLYWIKRYFEANEVTLNKIKYFENKTNSSLNFFRGFLNISHNN